jgi:hypothetical protein
LSPTSAGCPGMPSGATLIAGPSHPLAMPPWNRPGGSLPNVHQMVQHPQQPMDYVQWNYWQAQNAAAAANNMAQANSGHHQRTRSPGATSHYHPYMNRPQRSNERIPPLENHVIAANVHLQPPDPSWSRARSDPTIHMNAMNAAYGYGNVQQWMPEFRVNGVPTQHGHQQQHQQQQQSIAVFPVYSVPSQPVNVQQQHSPPQNAMSPDRPQSSQGMVPPHSPMDMSVGSLPNMHSPMMQHAAAAQAAAVAAQAAANSGMNCYGAPCGSTSSPQSPAVSNSGSMPNTPGGYNPHQAQQPQVPTSFSQQLITPSGFTTDSSQSAPTSPAQHYEQPVQQKWPSSRHYSASPESMDIPNIVLTGADGTLDCFQDLQDLHLQDLNEIQQLLTNGEQHVDPACETQLLN